MQVQIDLVPGNAWLPLAIRQASRRGLIRLRIAAGVLILIGVLSTVSGLSVSTGVTDPSDVGVGAAVIVAGCLLLLSAQRAPGRAVKLQPRYALTEPGVIEITDAGVTQTYPSARIAFAWSAFVRVVETPQIWLLYTGRISVIYVPKEPSPRRSGPRWPPTSAGSASPPPPADEPADATAAGARVVSTRPPPRPQPAK